MNYLHRANSHIASSHMLRGKKRSRSAAGLLLIAVAVIGAFFLLKNPIASGFYGLKGIFVTDAPAGVSLVPGALDAELAALRLENDELRQLVGKRMETDGASDAAEKEVVASVLMRPPQMPFDSLVINAGTDDGIAVGDQAYAFSSFPIGEIASATGHSSVIRLFSAPGNKVEVLIGSTTIAVTAEGKGGGNFFLKLPKATEIAKGEMVMRAYLPPEAFSSIESVDSTEGEAYTYAYFKLPVNIHSIVYVIVKKDSAR